MLELGLVLALVLVLSVGQGMRHRVNAQCRAGGGTRKNRSGRARTRCRPRGEVVPVRVLKAAFRGTLHNLCHLRLAPAQGSHPKKKCVRTCSGAGILRMRGMRGMRRWGARNCGPRCEKECENARMTKQRERNEKTGDKT